MIIDSFIHLEHLSEDLRRLEEKFDLKLLDFPPVTKGNVRTDRTPAHELMYAEQQLKCVERNKIEFDMFGYNTCL